MEENKSTPAPQLAGEALMNEVRKKKKAAANGATNSTPAPKVQPQPQTQPPANENPDDGGHKIFSVSIADFVKDFKPLQWFIYGYLQKNALAMCFGASRAGKSFVALDMALHIAVKQAKEDGLNVNGQWGSLETPELENWHGQVVHGGRVFYVAGEGVVGMKKRALGWLQYYNIDPQKIANYFRFSENPLPLDESDDPPYLGGWTRLKAELEALRTSCNFVPDLIIFDTLNRNMRGEENSAKETAVVIDHAQELVSGKWTEGHGVTVVFIHHTGWGKDAQGRSRGSTAWPGSMDIVLRVAHGAVSTIEGGKPVETHFAVVDAIKCKDDEEQARLYLERKHIEILDADSNLIPRDDGKYEGTLILETVYNDDPAILKMKVDGEEEKGTSGRGASSGKGGKKDAKTEDKTPPAAPAKEEPLDADDKTLLAMM